LHKAHTYPNDNRKSDPMKVLYVYAAAGSPVSQCEQRLVEKINAAEPDMQIEFWDWTQSAELSFNPTGQWARENLSRLAGFYGELRSRSQDADIVLISQTGGIVPEEMAKLSGTVVYNTADDPDSSRTCSFPYLQAADVIVHAGVNFDAQRTIAQVFRERGAKRCMHFPLGFYEEQFPAIEDFDAQFDARDIDLVYLGHLKRGKLEPVMRAFGGMVVHSRSLRLKHKLYILAKTGKWVRPYTGDVAALYRRCKVGINMHFSYGPSNGRCYQLNASGVAQVVDCPEGIGRLYEVGDEVLGYADIAEAIEKVRSLLADRELRYEVARRGYERARRDYNRRHIMTNLLRSIWAQEAVPTDTKKADPKVPAAPIGAAANEASGQALAMDSNDVG